MLNVNKYLFIVILFNKLGAGETIDRECFFIVNNS